jgi:hypothetical protein
VLFQGALEDDPKPAEPVPRISRENSFYF